MNEVPLYDLDPALWLMLTGLLVAIGPLAWVWWRSRHAPLPQRLRLLTLVTLFLTFDLVLFGAFTRLSDSGLGCPDWPGCYGNASPLGAHAEITQAQSAMPSGPVTHPKAWIEMIHRYLATGVGVLILTLAAMTWVAYRQARQGTPANPMAAALKPWWASFTLLWVCLQGAFGALTVTMKLFPLIVTLHLLGGLVLLALLRAQSQRFARAAGELKVVGVSPLTWLLLLTTFGLLWFQLALGGWVSTNYAVLACTQFPGCQGSLWPAMDWQQGFTLWRALGAGRDGGYISFEALTAIHYAHRLAAYLVLAALLLLARQLYKVPALRAQALWVLALALWQLATGLSNVLYGWPLLAAVSHTDGAAGLVVVLTGALFNCRPATALRFGSKSKASRLSS